MKFAVLFLLLSLPGWAKWSVSTYNIRNFDQDADAGATNLTELGKIIQEVKSDVMGFNEVVNLDAFKILMTKNLPDYHYVTSTCGGFGKQHLAVVYNPKVFKFQLMTEDMNFSGSGNRCGSLRPVMLVTLEHIESKKVYTFGTVHLKAGGNDRAMAQRWLQYGLLKKLIAQYSNKNLILFGDFNTTGYNVKDQDFEKFEDLLTSSQLRTSAEETGCTSYWHGGNEEGEEHISSILDHVVVQDKNFASVESVKVASHCARLNCRPASPKDLGLSYQSVSDHCPVQVTFK